MKRLVFVLIIAACVTASARQDELAPEGVSPDNRYSFFIEQQDIPNAPIYYVIRNRKDGAIVGRFESSYQPDPYENDFAWSMSHPTSIYWRPDSQYVAIDEANHRRSGTVILARQTAKGFHRVALNAERLMAFTKEAWNRGRLFFGKDSWLPRNRASIAIIGLVPNRQKDGYDHVSYEVIVDLQRDAAVVKASKLDE